MTWLTRKLSLVSQETGPFSFVIPENMTVSITGGGITGSWTGPTTKVAASGSQFQATVRGGGGGGGNGLLESGGYGGSYSYVEKDASHYIAAGGGAGGGDGSSTNGENGGTWRSAIGGEGVVETGNVGVGYATGYNSGYSLSGSGGEGEPGEDYGSPGGAGGYAQATFTEQGVYNCYVGWEILITIT